MIEAPNETGISIYSERQEEFSDASVAKAKEFLNGWTLATYTQGVVDSETGSDNLPPGASWIPQTGISCARKSQNGKKGTSRNHAYSSDPSQQGDKILISDYLT